jgi:hypothetical protein
MGKGELLRSAPRNQHKYDAGNYAVAEARTYGCGVFGVTPDSDVNRGAKVMTNAGRAPGAGLVLGAWVGNPGV